MRLVSSQLSPGYSDKKTSLLHHQSPGAVIWAVAHVTGLRSSIKNTSIYQSHTGPDKHQAGGHCVWVLNHFRLIHFIVITSDKHVCHGRPRTLLLLHIWCCSLSLLSTSAPHVSRPSGKTWLFRADIIFHADRWERREESVSWSMGLSQSVKNCQDKAVQPFRNHRPESVRHLILIFLINILFLGLRLWARSEVVELMCYLWWLW